MIDAIRTDNSGPTLSSRNLAILHTAIYDAINSITRTHQPYQSQLAPPLHVSLEAAATAAACAITKALYPGSAPRADELLQSFLSTTTRDAALTNGLALGTEIARLALASREADGAHTEVPYIPSDLPGQWRRTPPFFRPPVAPHWRYVDLFGLPELDRFLPPPPPNLQSPEYALGLNEVKTLGGKTSTLRTAEQSQIAVFWSDFSYTSMPPGHWHLIAADIARAQNTSLADTARLFALLSIAQADAATVCWEAKYRWNLWRPVTAIQRAHEDANPATEADATWEHFLNAPPFPSYPSGHSTFSAASAQVLAHFYGTDALSFTATSDSLPGVTRSFHSLAACADEIGLSRIYGGIHFSFDNVHGKNSGRKIGAHIAANWLLPNSRLPALAHEQTTPAKTRLRIHAHIGQPFILEGATNLKTWTPIATNTATPGGTLLELDQTQPHFFYRVLEKQN
jgi:membrane-associated phospholipid phosphatase